MLLREFLRASFIQQNKHCMLTDPSFLFVLVLSCSACKSYIPSKQWYNPPLRINLWNVCKVVCLSSSHLLLVLHSFLNSCRLINLSCTCDVSFVFFPGAWLETRRWQVEEEAALTPHMACFLCGPRAVLQSGAGGMMMPALLSSMQYKQGLRNSSLLV